MNTLLLLLAELIDFCELIGRFYVLITLLFGS